MTHPTVRSFFPIKSSILQSISDYDLDSLYLFVSGHIWSDFSPVTYTYWAPGEPNNAGNVEDCVEMYPNDGKWNDIRCDGKRNWICKTVRGGRL